MYRKVWDKFFVDQYTLISQPWWNDRFVSQCLALICVWIADASLPTSSTCTSRVDRRTRTTQGQGDWLWSPWVRVHLLSSKTQTAPGHFDWSWSPLVQVHAFIELQREVRHVITRVNAKKYAIFRIINYAMSKRYNYIGWARGAFVK